MNRENLSTILELVGALGIAAAVGWIVALIIGWPFGVAAGLLVASAETVGVGYLLGLPDPAEGAPHEPPPPG